MYIMTFRKYANSKFATVISFAGMIIRYKLGELYSKGELVEKDDVKAQEWMDRYYATF